MILTGFFLNALALALNIGLATRSVQWGFAAVSACMVLLLPAVMVGKLMGGQA
jgi:hypothetical protein